MPLDPKLLELLACPACRGALSQPREDALACAACGRTYEILDGIPKLIVE